MLRNLINLFLKKSGIKEYLFSNYELSYNSFFIILIRSTTLLFFSIIFLLIFDYFMYEYSNNSFFIAIDILLNLILRSIIILSSLIPSIYSFGISHDHSFIKIYVLRIFAFLSGAVLFCIGFYIVFIL
jgi:hypothetical protein